MLNSSRLRKREVQIQVPTVWAEETSYKRQFYNLELDQKPTTINLYQAIDPTKPIGLLYQLGAYGDLQPMIGVSLTAIPSRLISADVYLLMGKNEDDFVRVLFLPEKGPPEMKHLRVTMKQIFHKLEDTARAFEPNMGELDEKELDTLREMESRGNIMRLELGGEDSS